MNRNWKSTTVAMVAALTASAMAKGAFMGQNFTVPITFTAPSSDSTYDFSVPGFNPKFGTLTGVGLALNTDYGTSTLDWTITNTGTTTVSGSDAYSESETVKLLRADTNASLESSAGSSSATFGFSLAPGDQTVVRARGTGGGGSLSLSAANRTYFNRADGSVVPLRIESIGANLSLQSGLSLVSQTGNIQTSVSGTVTYTYTSNNTTPPPSTPIVISSSNPETLSTAGEVDWYSFQYASGALQIDTLGSNLTNGNDTFIALFNSTGTRVAQNDDGPSGYGGLSRISLTGSTLSAGTYYVAVAAYGANTAFGAGFSANSDGTGTGPYVLNLTGTAVPEPAAAGLLGSAVLLLRRRRGR